MKRLAIVLLVAPLLGTVFIPFLGIVAAPAVFAGTCWVLRAYFRYHFLREHRREGVTVLEKVFLVVMAALFVLLLIVFGVLVWLGVSFLPGGTPR